MSSKTIFDKLWDQHVIAGNEGEPQLLYIDLHVIHEVTSPQAFQGLREAGRRVRRKDLTYGTLDHNVPTQDIFNIQEMPKHIRISPIRAVLKRFTKKTINI